MEITIYSKKRTTKEGKSFYNFLSTLTRKDGSTLLCTVKFRDEAGPLPKPELCPMNIIVEKKDCNLSTKKFTRQTTDESGDLVTEEGQSYTLWVSKWIPGSQFEDHSLDDIF